MKNENVNYVKLNSEQSMVLIKFKLVVELLIELHFDMSVYV